MTRYTQRLDGSGYRFDGLVELPAKATPRRSADELAGCAAATDAERAAAQWAPADVPLTEFLDDPVVPYETDEITRLIIDTHDRAALARTAHLTVGGLRDWLLSVAAGEDGTDPADTLGAVAPGLTPEMVAAVGEIMRDPDLIAVARATRVHAAFRTTIGTPGTLATRLQPNHPTDDPRGIAAAVPDGLLLGCGDAVIGINPVTDSSRATADLLELLDEVRTRFDIPAQSCVLSHVTTLGLIEAGAPVDVVFQPVAGTESANASFGVNLVLVLIGERPGLSVADSLGIYLTHRPRPGRTDAERNCVSNIHPPDGLGYVYAAVVVAGLIAGARRLGRSGVDLKDTSRDSLPEPNVMPKPVSGSADPEQGRSAAAESDRP
ncbi:ethanolamine ammonia-lyase subunit EutB [Nocardia brevicatena]|uniref:ethanolamine ammonia-lyase subunit EutB n=1 Tax=Nocardia brevicatena TaxID=37327 RepID=UPI000A03EA2B|nr:ethanolamine ammonia-lyase subunit EutB [Nocardia brevicatena]